MRHTILTVSILAAVLLSSCAEGPTDDAAASTLPDAIVSSTEPTQLDRRADTQTAPSFKTPISTTGNATLPAKYQGLSPKEISRAEIDELIALQEIQQKGVHEFQKTFAAWNEQDVTRRGPQPTWNPSSLSNEDSERLQTLNGKLQLAEIRNKYKNFDPKILTNAEVEEIISLEQEQAKILFEHRNKIAAWAKQDPATRGERPEVNDPHQVRSNPRLQELQAKIQSVHNVKRFTDRIEKLSEAHNITLSDSEMSELMALQTEQQKFQFEMSEAMMEVQKEVQLNGGNMDPSLAIEKIPKHLVQRMFDTQLRIQAIQGPLEAAEKADQVRKRMEKLSEISGVPILSGEVSETIALNAEKDRIQNKTQFDAARKWLTEGGPMIDAQQPLPNDEDYARIKEIDARLKAIAAPMDDAKNAALEASNPALRQQRLDREERQKWQDDWKDRQQAGEIPLDVRLTSPSYAELQDRVKDYRQKLTSRAKQVGYSLPEVDMEHLESLNDEMLAIRKTVYDMEAGGTSKTNIRSMHNLPAFELKSGMYKIQLIETKQREILAALSEAENPQSEAPKGNPSATGTQQYGQRGFTAINGQYGTGNGFGAESIIQEYRMRGAEISQSDADDLLAFERKFKDGK